MDMDFDFGPIVWGLVVAGVVISNLVKSLRKAGEMTEAEETMDDSIEESEAPNLESVRRVTRESQRGAEPREERSNRAFKSDGEKPSLQSENQATESEENHTDFDLRQAVIMSEILKRKYED